MPYSTQADIQNQMDQAELIRLTDDRDLGAVDATVLAGAIADADAEIDSYCGNRYAVPLETATAMIRKVSRDIAIFNLYGRNPQGPPDNVKARYDAAVRFLKDVSAGKVSLGANAPAEQSEGGPVSTTSVEDRVFTAETLKNF